MYFSNIDYIFQRLWTTYYYSTKDQNIKNVDRKAYLKSFSKQVTGIENLPIQILCKAYYKYFTVALKTGKKCNNN